MIPEITITMIDGVFKIFERVFKTLGLSTFQEPIVTVENSEDARFRCVS